MKRILLFIATVLCSAIPTFAAFSECSPLVLDHTKIPSTLTNKPVLVLQTDNRFKTIANGGTVADAEGDDIRPYSDAAHTSALTYQKVFYSATAGTLEMRVLEASLSSSVDTTIYLCYGDAALTSDGSSTATWPTAYKGVWHLADGTTLSLADGSQSGYNGTNHSMSATTGQIDGGITNNGTAGRYADISGANLQINGAVTIKAWIYSANVTNEKCAVFSAGTGFVDAWGMCLNEADNAGKLGFYWGTAIPVVSTSTLSINTWYHVVMTRSGSAGNWTGKIYINGAIDTTTSGIATDPNGSSDVQHIGDYGLGGLEWNGKIDEVQVYAGTWSADEVTADYNNESNPSTFETLGTAVPIATASKAFFFFGNR